MKQDKIRVIFFDLDDTLFDYSASSRYAKEEVFKYLLEKHPHLERENIIRCYDTIISEAVTKEARGSYSSWDRRTRFSKLLKLLGLNSTDLSKNLAMIYTKAREKTTKPFPGTHEVLKKLKLNYSLGIITNGPSEYQRNAIRALGLPQYVRYILISGEVGCQKPELEIFQLALKKADCNASEAVMVGDSLSYDIRPARKIGMNTVLFDSRQKYVEDIVARGYSDHIIYDISELMGIY